MDDYANPPLIVPSEKLKIVQDADQSCATFIIAEEDHTLGNALRHILAKNNDVEFVGYSLPHPSEAKLHLRLQTLNKKPATQVVESGLHDLINIGDHLKSTFTSALQNFKSMSVDQ